LWAAAESTRLTNEVSEILCDSENEILLSAAASWEISLKYGLQKLRLPLDPATYVASRTRTLGFLDLPIEQRHALAASSLPAHHNDPFDRIMIAQAQLEGLIFITANALNLKYPCRLLDAS
jgi:PIN domain nuclease of toxin-antitoxin system